jgi:glycosyltransferase involved in cell wall biosynthesis
MLVELPPLSTQVPDVRAPRRLSSDPPRSLDTQGGALQGGPGSIAPPTSAAPGRSDPPGSVDPDGLNPDRGPRAITQPEAAAVTGWSRLFAAPPERGPGRASSRGAHPQAERGRAAAGVQRHGTSSISGRAPTNGGSPDPPFDVLYVDSQVSERATFVVRELAAVASRVRIQVWSVRPIPARGRDWARTLSFPVAHLNPLSPLAIRDWTRRLALEPSACWRALTTILRLEGPGLRRRAKAGYAALLAMTLAERVHNGEIQARRLHAHWGTSPSTVAWMLSTLTGVPYSMTVHASDLYLGSRMLQRKLRDASAVVTCTEFNAAFLRRRTARVRHVAAHVVRHGLPLEDYVYAPCAAPGPPFRILAVGRYVASKGFAVLLEALAQLRPDTPFVCELYGENGPEKRVLAARLDAMGLRPQVSVRDWIAPPALRDVFRRSHVLVVPSVVDAKGAMDGLPNVIIEALALGLPVLATSLSGIPEAVVDGITGLLVPPGDPRALADALRRLLRDQDLRAAVSRSGRALVERVFDEQSTTDELLRVILPPPGPGRASPIDGGV